MTFGILRGVASLEEVTIVGSLELVQPATTSVHSLFLDCGHKATRLFGFLQPCFLHHDVLGSGFVILLLISCCVLGNNEYTNTLYAQPEDLPLTLFSR